MQIDINHIQHYFFIGVAGTGMSALAQYLSGINKQVSGSDREFKEGKTNVRRTQLEAMNIQCFSQDASGITEKTQLIIASTAIESSNPEIQKAKALGIPLVNRSDLLNAITRTRKTIAVAGTSGKSTTVGMIFHILHTCNLSPSLITGAGISSLKTKNRIGNAYVGSGEWLVIEADESDGSLVKYHPEVGLILNVDKDHKELTTLHEIFGTFHSQIKDCIITNTSHPETLRYSTPPQWDFGLNQQAGYQGKGFKQQGFEIQFRVKHVEFRIPTLGKHNMENALAAIAVAQFLGLSLGDCAYALRSYPGIHRRHQIVGRKKGVWLIDDYAHNPAKLATRVMHKVASNEQRPRETPLQVCHHPPPPALIGRTLVGAGGCGCTTTTHAQGCHIAR